MHKNSTHLVREAGTQLLEKAHIYEAELSLDPAVQQSAPLCAQLDADRSLAVLLSIFLPQLTLDEQAIKLQVNTGAGGCFPMHFDSDETLDGRRVTCIFYLNPGWAHGNGGELRLYPFPRGPPIDIAPLGNRLVLFASTRMVHRVLPSAAAERACFTIWLSQSRRRPRAPTRALSDLARAADPSDHAGAAAALLLLPAVRKHVVRLVYASEWARSIEESHPEGRGRDEAVAQHWREVDIIRRALKDYLPAIAALERSAEDGGAKHSVAWL
ncbi:hypothetical protein FOA52_001526 [Chlamydomonas sp. UWO 241]|nr:hypothetical protein FOA52_001526 [Chlamydomonas sp. UWO 241]